MAEIKQGNILVVDDIPNNLHLLVSMLSRKGYIAWPASNGEQALLVARSQSPDLILLDIMMPGMNGYDVCRELKADKATRDIPVIFLSALDELLNKIEAFAVGGVDYVTKPFHTKEVLARVETHLKIRRLQTELEAQIAELHAFAHTVAHDLKTPLTIVQGYADLLAHDMPDTVPLDIHLFVERIGQGTVKAQRIVDELLLLAGIGREVMVVTAVHTANIISLVLDRLQGIIQEYGAQINQPDAWVTAVGYAPWLEEVWANYISNALKYGGQPPEITLGSTALDNGRIQFWIQDNGNGIAPEDQCKLFVEFSRIDTERGQGHGLGLSIVKRIIQRLGGEVGVESQVGQGSKFYFTLPVEAE